MRSLTAILLLGFTLGHGPFSGQITSVESYLDTEKSPFIGDKFFSIVAAGPIQPDGNFTVSNFGQFTLIAGSNEIKLPEDKDIVFQYELGFSSSGIPEENQQDPKAGGLMATLLSFYTLIAVILTDKRSFAFISQYDMSTAQNVQWIIPLAKRLPEDLDKYSIAVNKAKRSFTFWINDEKKLVIPGIKGIDPRFLTAHNSASDTRSLTDYTAETFPTAFLEYFLLGNLVFSQQAKPVCQDALYDICVDPSISYTPSCRCRFDEDVFVASTPITYNGRVRKAEVFVIEETDRCVDGSQSELSQFQWWIPKMDGSE